jgi:hypothetical protein
MLAKQKILFFHCDGRRLIQILGKRILSYHQPIVFSNSSGAAKIKMQKSKFHLNVSHSKQPTPMKPTDQDEI